jgi:hypothetical protein
MRTHTIDPQIGRMLAAREAEQRDRLTAILDSIEKHAATAINETAYMYSYEAGSTRYYQAKARADKAEAAMMSAIEKMRAKLSEAV